MMLPCTAASVLLAVISFLILVQPRQGSISESVISDALELESRNVVLLPINALGLANRLRIMSSLYAISQAQNAALMVIWGQSDDCNSSFADLFNSRDVQVISLPEEDSAHGVFESLVRTAVHKVSISKNVSAQEYHLRDFLVNTDMRRTTINLIWTRGTHAPHISSCGDYLYAKSMFYRLLTPSEAVMRLIDSVGAQFQNSESMLAGVHVRAFDTQYDWPVVSPSLFAVSTAITTATRMSQYQVNDNQGAGVVHNLQSKRFDEASSLDAFIQLMSGLVHTNPNIRFFLASNSAIAKQIIQAHFGTERIIALDSAEIGLRGTSPGIIVAAAEFYLLGETAFVVHSRGSSFAREAASRRMLPVIDVALENLPPQNVPQQDKDDSGAEFTAGAVPLYFYTQRESLPYCGMPEYIRVGTAAMPLSTSSKDVQSGVAAGSASTGEDIHQQGDAPGSPVRPIAKNGVHRVCYAEDDRVVCTAAYVVCPCQLVNQHPLYGVHYEKLMCNVPEDSVLVTDARCVTLLAESNGYSL